MRRFLAASIKVLSVASLLAIDWVVLPFPVRQFRYGETWVRVHLITGKTEVLFGREFLGPELAGWRRVPGVELPPPEAGRGAHPTAN
jgi:hypothetical protein